METGLLTGEKCNRNGCDGIISNHGKEGSCSCHINPPCDYCVTSDEYCPICGWEGREDQIESNRTASENSSSQWWEEQQKKIEEKRNRLYAQMAGKLPVTEFDYEALSHTHSTMIKQGVYPTGMTPGEVREKVNGTFGGRFEHFGNNTFRFIAYTD